MVVVDNTSTDSVTLSQNICGIGSNQVAVTMAKGLRSKTKRRARTHLRETLSGPLAVKRQLKIAENVKSSLIDKDCTTILKLKSVLSKAAKTPNTKETVEDSVEEEEKPCGENKAFPSVVLRKPSKFTIESNKQQKTGKQPGRNAGKPLVWFK
jgi:hypothetical protein